MLMDLQTTVQIKKNGVRAFVIPQCGTSNRKCGAAVDECGTSFCECGAFNCKCGVSF